MLFFYCDNRLRPKFVAGKRWVIAIAAAAVSFLGALSAPSAVQASATLTGFGVDQSGTNQTPVGVALRGAASAPALGSKDLPVHDPTVGTLAGEAGVDGGAARYSMSFALPPGRKGMAPSVGLSYGSRSGAGIAGMGVSITGSGQSSIHRCPKTPEQDGTTAAVRLDATDRLCLDGQRLIQVDASTLQPVAGQGGYGTVNAVYKTEVDSFVRVTQLGGNLASGTSCFTVELKSGEIRHYGARVGDSSCLGGATGRVVPGGKTVPLSWLLEREQDRLGNTVTYTHAAYAEGEVLLSAINYTGYGSDIGDRKVEFEYKTRPARDQSSSYISGGLTRQTQRLRSVTIKIGASTLRSYTLTYGSASSYSGRSLLRSVQECSTPDDGGAAVCHPATRFTYNEAAINYPLQTLALPILSGSTQLVLDGAAYGSGKKYASLDGYVDALTHPASLNHPNSVTATLNLAGLYELGDFDGDGVREVLARYNDLSSTNAPIYQIVSFNADRSIRGSFKTSDVPGLNGQFEPVAEYVDLNSDGRADIVGVHINGSTAEIALGRWIGQAGAAWQPSNFAVTSLGITTPTPLNGVPCAGLSVADLNGDGVADLLVTAPSGVSACPSRPNNRELRVYLATGISGGVPTFSNSPNQTVALQQAAGYFESVDHTEDFDGDGLPDVILSLPSSENNPQKLERLLFGRNTNGVYTLGGSGRQIDAYANFASPPLVGFETNKSAFTLPIDVNGDGLSDLVSLRPVCQRNGTNAVVADSSCGSGTPPSGFHRGGAWSVRLNTGGLLGPRIDTDVTRGAEFCRAGGTGQTCLDRVSPTFAPRISAHDVDTDGRLEILVPREFAARLCINHSQGGENEETFCPEQPLTGQRDPATDNVGLINVKPMYANGSYASLDPSAYKMDALHFVQTGASSFDVVVEATQIVGNGGNGFDLYGDGLQDAISYLGCGVHTVSSSIVECIDPQVAGDPTTLPDDPDPAKQTPVSSLVTRRIAFIAQNVGTSASPPPVGQVPALPELMFQAVDGLGDTAIWIYSPLSAGLSPGGLALYSLPDSRYVDSRHYYFSSTMPVVAGFAQSNGIGGIYGARSWSYGYSEAMYNHQGRGFQGFRKITRVQATAAADTGRALQTITTYHQKFPLTGNVKTTEVTPYVPGVATTPVTLETDDWRCNRTKRTDLCPGDGGAPAAPARDTVYAPYLDRSVATTYDLASAEAGTTSPIREIESVNAGDSTVSGWDNFGNLTEQRIYKRDLGTGTFADSNFVRAQTTSITRHYTNDTSTGFVQSWFLGRLVDESVTKSIQYNVKTHALPKDASAPSQTVVTRYTWNDDRTPLTRTVQPEVTNQESITTWCYTTTSTACPTVPSGLNYGLPSSVLTSAPGVSPARRTTYACTNDGTTEVADGYFVLTTTNALGHVTTTKVRPRDGQTWWLTDANGVQEKHTFDAFGRALHTDHLDTKGAAFMPPTEMAMIPCSGGSSCALAGDKSKGDDRAAYRTTTTQDGTPTRVAWHDLLGRQVKSAERGFDGTWIVRNTTYDAMGTLSRTTVPHFPLAKTVYSTSYTYDRLGRPTAIVQPASDLRPGNGNRSTFTTYSGQRTTVRVQDSTINAAKPCPASKPCMITKTYASVTGDTMRVVDTLGNATDHWHDGAGNLVASVDAGGAITRSTFDALGRRSTLVDPDQGASIESYNAFGEVVSQTDARGAVITVTKRDALGRVTEQTSVPPAVVPTGMASEATTDTWKYDPAGGLGLLDYVQRQRAAVISRSAPVVWKELYQYEATTKRLSTITTTMEGEGAAFVSTQTYDSSGRPSVHGYPSGLGVETTYGSYGHLQGYRNSANLEAYWTTTNQDAWGKVTSDSFGNGIVGGYTNYQSTGQSKQLKWTSSGSGLDQADYTYDSFGNLTKQTRAATLTETYTYDPLQRLLTATKPDGSVSYGYTSTGNLDKKSDYSLNSTGAYTYGAGGCGPHAVSSVRYATSSYYTYTCDAAGNVVGGNTINAVFDAQNKPRSITRLSTSGDGIADRIFKNDFDVMAAAGGTQSWYYDSVGGRYRELGSSTTSYGPGGYEKTVSSGVLTHRHELGPVIVSRVNGADTVRYVLRDRLGSTLSVTDLSQAVNESRAFDAFGKARDANLQNRSNGTANLASTNHGFTGHTQADDVWLVHMNGRVYDQNLGRFLSVDPIVQGAGSQALNPYSYIYNNPLSGTDPSGYADCTDKGEAATQCKAEVPTRDVRAATITGSHIAGANTGAEIDLVNPSKQGLESLAVALSGVGSSGAVVQGTTPSGTSPATDVGGLTQSADKARQDSRAPKEDTLLDGLGKGTVDRIVQAAFEPLLMFAILRDDEDTGIDEEIGTDGLDFRPFRESNSSVGQLGYDLSPIVLMAGTAALGRLAVAGEEIAVPKPGSAGGPGAGKAFSPKVKDAARAEANNRCVFCQRKTTREAGPLQSNIDHAIAKSRGGNNTLANAQNTCWACNNRKSALNTVEFLEKLGMTPPW